MIESIYKAMISAKDNNVEETTKFILMIDKFFDALNVTNLNNGQRNIKSLVFSVPIHVCQRFSTKSMQCHCP